MTRVAAFLSTLLFLYYPFASSAQTQVGLTPDSQEQAIETIANTFESMGQTETARRLRAGFKDGSIRFGTAEETDGEGAVHDFYAQPRVTIINETIGVHVLRPGPTNDPEGQSATLYGAALTIHHELVHAEQDFGWWNRERAKQLLGGVNACEREAWSSTFNQIRLWLALLLNRYKAAAPGSPEQDRIAQQLRGLFKHLTVIKNDYDASVQSIGHIGVINTPKGPRTVNPDRLLKYLRSGPDPALRQALFRCAGHEWVYHGNHFWRCRNCTAWDTGGWDPKKQAPARQP